MVHFQHRVERPEIYSLAWSQRSDCLVKNGVVKVNKLQLGYCAADWRGTNVEMQAERCVLTAFICMYVWECVLLPVCPVLSIEGFSWQRLPADLSVLLSLQGCEMTHQGAHLGPCNLFRLFPSHFCFPNCVSFLFFHLHFGFPRFRFPHSSLSLSHV